MKYDQYIKKLLAKTVSYKKALCKFQNLIVQHAKCNYFLLKQREYFRLNKSSFLNNDLVLISKIKKLKLQVSIQAEKTTLERKNIKRSKYL